MRLIDADAIIKEIKARNPDDVSYEDAWAITCIEHAPTIEPQQTCEYWDSESKFCALCRPSAQPERRWIPCSERLPEEGQDILAYRVFGDEERIIPANYGNGCWFDCHMNCLVEHIIAWMPLPEPYKERGTDE